MSEQKSVKIHNDVLEKLKTRFPDMSINKIVEELSTAKSIISLKIYRLEDVMFGIETIKEYREKVPGISVDEMLKFEEEYIRTHDIKEE